MASELAQSVTRHAMDWEAPGIEAQWGEIFRAIQTGPEVHPVSCSVGTGSFPGAKRQERDAEYPPPSRAGLQMGRSYTS